MNTKIYFQVTGVIFLVIAVLHALRVFYSWEAEIGGWVVPVWLRACNKINERFGGIRFEMS